MVDLSRFVNSGAFQFVLVMQNSLGMYTHRIPLSKRQLLSMKSRITRVKLSHANVVLVYAD